MVVVRGGGSAGGLKLDRQATERPTWCTRCGTVRPYMQRLQRVYLINVQITPLESQTHII